MVTDRAGRVMGMGGGFLGVPAGVVWLVGNGWWPGQGPVGMTTWIWAGIDFRELIAAFNVAAVLAGATVGGMLVGVMLAFLAGAELGEDAWPVIGGGIGFLLGGVILFVLGGLGELQRSSWAGGGWLGLMVFGGWMGRANRGRLLGYGRATRRRARWAGVGGLLVGDLVATAMVMHIEWRERSDVILVGPAEGLVSLTGGTLGMAFVVALVFGLVGVLWGGFSGRIRRVRPVARGFEVLVEEA